MSRPIHSRVILKEPKVVFKHLDEKKGVVGLAYSGLHKAEIETRQNDAELIKTCVHELFGHLMLPDLSEKQVIRLEKIYGTALWKVILRLKRKWLKSLDKS